VSIVKEFKEFALRGSVVDLAVGIVIGGAFGKIVSSVVNDVIMPPIGVLIGGVDFSHLALTIKAASAGAGGEEIPAVTLKYGSFINTVVDFLIVAAAIFVLVKVINIARRRELQKPPAPAAPSPEVRVLTEIRDILKSEKV